MINSQRKIFIISYLDSSPTFQSKPVDKCNMLRYEIPTYDVHISDTRKINTHYISDMKRIYLGLIYKKDLFYVNM